MYNSFLRLDSTIVLFRRQQDAQKGNYIAKEEATMAVKPIPDGFHTVTPYPEEMAKRVEAFMKQR